MITALKRLGAVAAFVLLFNVEWNVAGSIAITPNSPAPVVYTYLGAAGRSS